MMRSIALAAIGISVSFFLSSCSSLSGDDSQYSALSKPQQEKLEKKTVDYAARMPQQITARGEDVIIVNPRVHAWGAYDPAGNLVKGGVATAGGDWCPDIHRPCHTRVGSYRINSLGTAKCKSTLYPLPHGGAPMPYCMFFNGNQALHGSYEVVDGNESHGCVRLHVADAEWIRFNFAHMGTKVIVESY